MVIDESRSFRATMAVIDTNEGGRRRREDLALILKVIIGLNHGDRVVTGSMRLQFRVPKKPISTTTTTTTPSKAAFQRPITRPQHHLQLGLLFFLLSLFWGFRVLVESLWSLSGVFVENGLEKKNLSERARVLSGEENREESAALRGRKRPTELFLLNRVNATFQVTRMFLLFYVFLCFRFFLYFC